MKTFLLTLLVGLISLDLCVKAWTECRHCGTRTLHPFLLSAFYRIFFGHCIYCSQDQERDKESLS